MVVVMLPSSKRLLQFIQCLEFVYPQQILLDGADHALRVRVALRVAIACEDMPGPEGLLVLRERLRCWSTAVVAGNRRNQQIRPERSIPSGNCMSSAFSMACIQSDDRMVGEAASARSFLLPQSRTTCTLAHP